MKNFACVENVQGFLEQSNNLGPEHPKLVKLKSDFEKKSLQVRPELELCERQAVHVPFQTEGSHHECQQQHDHYDSIQLQAGQGTFSRMSGKESSECNIDELLTSRS